MEGWYLSGILTAYRRRQPPQPPPATYTLITAILARDDWCVAAHLLQCQRAKTLSLPPMTAFVAAACTYHALSPFPWPLDGTSCILASTTHLPSGRAGRLWGSLAAICVRLRLIGRPSLVVCLLQLHSDRSRPGLCVRVLGIELEQVLVVQQCPLELSIGF